MSAERHARGKELFAAAYRLPPDQRGEFLRRALGDDDELRNEIESLLSYADPEADPATPAALSADRSRRWPEKGSPPEVPGYRVLKRLGEGGMGEVWEAEQQRPVRRVALKVIKWGMSSREVVARFESERQALALMSHPAIAKVFEAGTTAGGRPFFAMELVAGVPITEYCDTQRLTTGERLTLFVEVCQGVQHAHHKGVIHRDLKPSNVLVTLDDARPVPKIIDFGVAKATAQRLTERTLFTELGQWIGTPEYMSPEQAEMTGLDIDTRTDVYSLGALLYELLAGTQPFEARELREAGFDEMRRRIREQQPPRPSTRVSTLVEGSRVAAQRRRSDLSALARELRGDLDRITMKALEKDRTQRYGSPSELAADIDRHLRHQPVLASPPSLPYRARKFVRRHRLGVAAATLVLAALVLGAAGATFGLLRARQEAASARRFSGLLEMVFQDLDPGGTLGGINTPRRMLDQSVERIEVELAGEPLEQARLLATLGQVYGSLGLYDRGIPLLERSLTIRREHLGEDHLDVAASLHGLGLLLYQSGDYAAARDRYESALAIRERLLGPDQPAVAESLDNLALVLWRLGEYDRAAPLYERALAIQERTLGSDHPAVADTLYYQAMLLRATELPAGTLPLYERVLAIRQKAFGSDHTAVGWALYALGHYYVLAQDFDTARGHLERAIEIQKRALGEDHAAVAMPLRSLAQIFAVRRDFDTAVPLLERAVGIAERSLGSHHPTVAEFQMFFGLVLTEAGDFTRSRRLLERAAAVLERSLGPRHQLLAYCLEYLAFLEWRVGHPERARELRQRALAILEEAFGPEHVLVASFLEGTAAQSARLGDLPRARALFERALAIRRQTGGGRLDGILYNLACFAAFEGERARALELLRKVLDHGWAGHLIFHDPDLDPLRGDPEFEAMVAEVRRRLAERQPAGSAARTLPPTDRRPNLQTDG